MGISTYLSNKCIVVYSDANTLLAIPLQCMYLKKLYTTHKGWFIVIMLFIIIQLGLDVKQAISFTPAFHYGMYSSISKPQTSYAVQEVWVNGRQLKTKDFSPCGWDKVMQPIVLYSNQHNWNSSVWNNDIKRLMHFKDSAKYKNTLTETAFNTWYRSYMQTFLHEKIDRINIITTTYTFTGTQLVNKGN